MKKLLIVSALALALLPGGAAAGPSFTTQVATTTVVSGATDGRYDTTVNCPAGTAITGGGAAVSDAAVTANSGLGLLRDRPSGNGWQVTGATSTSVTITVFAVCGSV